MARTKVLPAPWDWIKEMRELAGISKNGMARRLEIQERAYRRWEQEPGVQPRFEHLARFCEITGADIRLGVRVIYGVTIPGYLNSPVDVLAGVA
jgi:transcriptional regulator with XRE-family HTH domain